MFLLRGSVFVNAPVERCFALSRSVEIVHRELGMNAVAGRTSGLVEENDTVRWEGFKLGFWHYHVSLIDGFTPPTFFRDRMIEGRFKSFSHDHFLEARPEGTLLYDELRFQMPWGPLGWLAGRAVLVPHIRKLMARRFALLKHIAETEEWRQYLSE